jgi:hypothetical protein
MVLRLPLEHIGHWWYCTFVIFIMCQWSIPGGAQKAMARIKDEIKSDIGF